MNPTAPTDRTSGKRERSRTIGLMLLVGPMLFVIFGLIVPSLLGPQIGMVYSNVVRAL